ncbi:hypothetical protein PIN31009_05583 [Pandoraea iniqua]|uniref:helix-turn-helix transcriptional regulator n=1 Tax=Pandoraea iniqua TaxID=2508288 RepID=UPI001242D3CD|nr:AlpA family phage regulatory protein [Pandoraea iniqua]VVE59550.1 hypothetical protein PIN31009_05583 [Pandoraea iniqua]
MNAQQHTEHTRAPKRARDDKPTLPAEGFVRLPQVLAVFPVSRTTWLRGVKEKRYPAPVQLSPSTVAWRVEDIRDLLASVAANGHETGGTSGGIGTQEN